MELSRGPLLLLRNLVKCGHCQTKLPPTAAGFTVLARYVGPQLAGVRITAKGRVVHECGKIGA